MSTEEKSITDRFPFLTVITYIDQEYIGIVQHADSAIVSMYVIDDSFTEQMKKDFIQCGEEYWWGSNRQIPINLFLKQKFSQFKPCLKTFSKKEVVIVQGPAVNIRDLVNKRIKRRTITLIRNME
jgi:hypothetical protein